MSGPDEEPLGAYIPAPVGRTYANPNGQPVWAESGIQFDPTTQKPIAGTSGADQDVQRYRSLGEAANNRAAYQLNYGNADSSLNLATGEIGNADNARGAQTDSLGLARSAAMGQAPSQAELLGRNTLDQGFQQQLAAASSARGGSIGQAAAMRAAQQGGAAYYQQGTNALAAMRANEMATARQDYANQAAGVRAGDLSSAGQYAGIGALQAQEANAQGQLEMQQRQLNQQGQQFGEQKAFDVNTAQLNADLQNQALAQGDRQFQVGVGLQQQQNAYNLMGAGIGAGATFGAAMARAKGGPVSGGQPYLVGEQGPELVVPKKDGVVVPAPQTAEVMSLYEPPGMQLHQSLDGHAYLDAGAPPAPAPSLSGPYTGPGAPRRSLGEVAAARAAVPPPALVAGATAASAQARREHAPQPTTPRKLTPAEMMAAANAMGAQMRAEHEARMAVGPAVRPPATAAGALAPYPYPNQGAMTPADFRAATAAGALAPPRLMGGRADPYAPSMGEVAARVCGGPMYSGRPYMVGEGGPEMVLPRRSR